MQVIPLVVTPAQTLSASLGGQPCRITLREKSTGLFLDLSLNDALVIGGVVGRNAVRIVRDSYLGFVGDLVFFDLFGTADPQYTGLGSRWILVYLSPADVAAGLGVIQARILAGPVFTQFELAIDAFSVLGVSTGVALGVKAA